MSLQKKSWNQRLLKSRGELIEEQKKVREQNQTKKIKAEETKKGLAFPKAQEENQFIKDKQLQLKNAYDEWFKARKNFLLELITTKGSRKFLNLLKKLEK